MIKSMTGYGKAELELPSKRITIEIKSLNSKQLDINTRLPGIYKEKDIEIRKLIAEKLVRGKVEFNLFCEHLAGDTNNKINQQVVKTYIDQLKDVYFDAGLQLTDRVVQTALRLPDTVKVEIEQLDAEEWEQIRNQISHAIEQLDTFRVQEGTALYADLESNIREIVNLKEQVPEFEKLRIEKIKERLQENLKNLSGDIKVDENRFEQELIYYLEKLDINEEEVRLQNHCNYFIETMNETSSSGKKLGFISQEIGREINTMGSKAYHADIQKLVILMKDKLEKIKEQILNVL